MHNSWKYIAKKADDLGVLHNRGVIVRGERTIRIGNDNYVDFSTKSYLGLEREEDLLSYVKSIFDIRGLGRSSSPIYYAPEYYNDLECALLDILHCETITLFASTSAANAAAINCVVPSGVDVFIDEYAHRSLQVPALRRFAHVMRYRHLDNESLLAQLAKRRPGRKALIVSDGVFSMSGASAQIQNLLDIVRMHEAYLLVDDAHGFGISGKVGEGSLEGLPVSIDRRMMVSGSLGKALPGYGGFLACSQDMAGRLRIKSSEYAFTAGIPMLYAAIGVFACGILGSPRWNSLVDRISHHWDILADILREREWHLCGHKGPLAVLEISTIELMKTFCMRLHEKHIAFNVVSWPAIPKGQYRLRFCLSAAHTDEHIQLLGSTLIGIRA